MSAELHRDIALEAGRRSPLINGSELWAALSLVDCVAPRLVVDLWSEPAVWWAWGSTGAAVVGVNPNPVRPGGGFSGDRLPTSVTEVVGDPRLPDIRERVVAAVGGRRVDVLVLGGPDSEDGVRARFAAYAPMVRQGGLVLVQGIANRQCPGIGRFWSDIRPDRPDRKELVGNTDPDGYGVLTMRGREAANHG